jgi:hypothetical protein
LPDQKGKPVASNPVLLSAVTPTLLPPIITEPIFLKTTESSAVQQLARKVPMAVNATTAIPVPMDIPTAGWVSEGGVKAVGSAGVGVKTMTGKKVALLVPVSQEIAMTNSAGLYDQLVQDLPKAIGRAFDYAAIHGLDLKSGGAGPFPTYLAQTGYSQVVGSTAASSGGVYADLVKGMQQVINGPIPYEFTGFAADPRIKPELMLSVDTQGRPFFLGQDSSALGSGGINAGSLVGSPVYFNPGVSGKYYRQGNAVQVITVNGSPTGGNFTLNIGGSTTATIAYNAAGSAVQTAIQALPTAAAAGATVSGSGPYTVTFAQAATPISVGTNALTGGTNPSVTVTESPDLDSGLRAIGGDWSQAAWGQGMDITIKLSTEANYYDGSNWHSAFQENLVLLLVEAWYGFLVNDKNAFVAYTHAADS